MKSVVTTVQGSETFHSNNWSSAKSRCLTKTVQWFIFTYGTFNPCRPPRADACTGHTDMRATLQRKRWPTRPAMLDSSVLNVFLRFCAVSVCEWNNQQLLCVRWMSNHVWLRCTQLVHSGIFHFSSSAKRCADSHFVRSNSCKLETFSSAPAVRCLQC